MGRPVCHRQNPLNSNQLYKNNGNGSFTKITTGPLVNTAEKTIASAWGDFNNDGNIDVFIVNATGSKSRLLKISMVVFLKFPLVV
ncbi:MAG: VCBS repeat-containing protein [Saprospiraceae bacterium]|nr:VCBS repeat-containing protein [Saprospiraceae bacterium]